MSARYESPPVNILQEQKSSHYSIINKKQKELAFYRWGCDHGLVVLQPYPLNEVFSSSVAHEEKYSIRFDVILGK